MTSNPITASLEMAAERGGDLTGVVYGVLFAQHPHLQAFFCNDTDGSVRGEMLAQFFEAVLDMAGEDDYGSALILSLAVNHDGLGVAPDLFPLFADAVQAAVREVLGPLFDPEMERAWRALVGRVHDLAAASVCA